MTDDEKFMKEALKQAKKAYVIDAGSVLNLLQMQQFNHQVEITRGVLEETCSSMLSAFFRELRQRKKKPSKSE